MKYDVTMRVWSGPRAFDDVTVTVEAASGDEAAKAARKKADTDKLVVNTIVPTPVPEKADTKKSVTKK